MWKFFDIVLYEALPRSLVGFIIPLTQLAWKLIQNRKEAKRKATLRARIAELGTQRETFGRLSPNAETALLIADLDAELKRTIDELLALRPDQGARPESARPWARALLLYVPSGGMGWLLHALFFLYLFGLVALLIAFLSDPSDPDLAFNLLGVYLLCFPAEFLRRLALRIDRRKRFPAEEQIVRPRKRWIPIILFWYATISIPCGALAPFMDEPGGFSMQNIKELYPYSIVFAAYFILLAVCARGWVNALTTETSGEPRSMGGVRSAFLLYRPNQPRGWLATVGFFASLGFLSASIVLLVHTRKDIGTDSLVPMAIVLFSCLLLIVAAKGWASQYRPRHSSDAAAESAHFASR